MNELVVQDLKILYNVNANLAVQAARALGLQIVAKQNPKIEDPKKKGLEEKKKNEIKLQKALPLIKKKLKKMGYNLGLQIAPSGRYGAPFDIGDTKVLKITLDPAEAKATNKLNEYNLVHKVVVYRIFKFKDLKDFFFIEQERLLPINKIEKQIITALKKLLKYSKHPLPFYKKYSKGFDRIKDPESYTLLKSNKKKFRKEVLGFLIKATEEGKIAPKDLKAIVLESEFMNQFFDTVNEFRQAGISRLDLHAGNVLRDSNGIVKLIDFGFKIQFARKP